MSKIMDKINKLTLPATILIASIILGGFYYASQVNKQNSIERQQEIKLQEDRRIEEARAEREKVENEAKIEQVKKEYIAKRKNECYDIYIQERKNWNNVEDFSYSEARDVCVVNYKSDKPAKTKEECEKIISNIPETTGDYLREIIFDLYSDCLENWFSKQF